MLSNEKPRFNGIGVIVSALSRGLILVVSGIAVAKSIVCLKRISGLKCGSPTLSHISTPTPLHIANTQVQTDFENDAIRFKFDALLREYDAIRREIEILIQQQERTFHYLIALIAGLLASQLLVSEFPMMDQTLNKNPSIYLAVALSGLWFPAQNVLLNAQMTALARYLRTVLTPKVNEIVRIADSRLASQHAIWEEAYFAKHVLGALSWEEFRAEVQYDRSRNLLTYAPLWVFRFVILSLPSMILTARYIEVRWVSSDVAWSKLLEIPLIIMLGILILGLLIGGYSEANVTRTHRTLSKEGRRTGR